MTKTKKAVVTPKRLNELLRKKEWPYNRPRLKRNVMDCHGADKAVFSYVIGI